MHNYVEHRLNIKPSQLQGNEEHRSIETVSQKIVVKDSSRCRSTVVWHLLTD